MGNSMSSKNGNESDPESISALRAPPRKKDNPLTRSIAGMMGIVVLVVMLGACLISLPYTLGSAVDSSGEHIGIPRYDMGSPNAGRLPPRWWRNDEQDIERSMRAIDRDQIDLIASEFELDREQVYELREGDAFEAAQAHWPRFWFGSDTLGRSLGLRLLAGGGISLTIGLAAALISVGIGTFYGAIAGYVGGKLDSIMMRIVDVLYGLPYILLVV